MKLQLLLLACVAVASATNLRSWVAELQALSKPAAAPCATAFLQRGEDDEEPKKSGGGSGSADDTPGLPKLDPCGVPNKSDLDAATGNGPTAANTTNVTAADRKAAAYTGMAAPKEDGATGATGSTGATGATGATGGAAAIEHEEKLESKKTAQGKIAAAKRALEKANEVELPVVSKKFKEPGCEKLRKVAQGAYMIAPKADKSDWTAKEVMKTLCGAYTEMELGKDVQGTAEWKDECKNSVRLNAQARGWKNSEKRLTADTSKYKGCMPPREMELLECAIAFGIEQNDNFLGLDCSGAHDGGAQ